MDGIRLFVGLGNPGEKYAATRHNAGFWWIDRIVAATSSKLVIEARFFGSTGRLNGTAEAWLLKPDTYMNASGKSVAAIANYYKISPSEIMVIHDDLDLLPGSAKIKKGGGHGGHNGLKDIASALGTPDFWRLRIGIGHPGDRNEVINFVLKMPTREEARLIEHSIEESAGLLPVMLEGDLEAAMLKLHTKPKVE